MSQSETPYLDDLLEKYYQISELCGKPMNGLARAQLRATMVESGAEEILQMAKMVEQWEDANSKFSTAYTSNTTSDPVFKPGEPNGTK